MLTGLLAAHLQHLAEDSRPAPDGYSPESEAIVDSSGWPIEERNNGPANDAGTGRSRSRLPPGPADPGA